MLACGMLVSLAAIGSAFEPRQSQNFSMGGPLDPPRSPPPPPPAPPNTPSAPFLFVAGLEGTGHHLVGLMMQACELCTEDRELSMLLWKGGSNPVTIFFAGDGDGRAHSGGDTHEALDARRERFVARLDVVKREQKGRLVVLNTANAHHSKKDTALTGEMSYPNYGGPHKADHYPDLVVLARLTVRARVALRVLVLHRPSEDILTSTTVHRSFETTVNEANILLKSAEALTAQLHTLEEANTSTAGDVSWLCVPFERIGDAAWWSEPAVAISAGGAGGAGAGTAHLAATGDASSARSLWLHPRFERGSATFAAMLSALGSSEARHVKPTSEVMRASVQLDRAESRVASVARCGSLW